MQINYAIFCQKFEWFILFLAYEQQEDAQTFDKTIENIVVKVGQQAVLPCFINNLGSYRVSLNIYL